MDGYFDNDALSVTSVGSPDNGISVLNGDDTVTYTPNSGFIGPDLFNYTITDNAGGVATGFILINVAAASNSNGDINGDGLVDTADVTLGYRILGGEVPPTSGQLQRGDVAPLISGVPTPNGEFNLGDVLLIQRKVLGEENF